MDRWRVFEKIKESGIVAILRSPEKDVITVASALREAGIQAVEITMDTPGVLEMVETFRMKWDDVAIGVGTVLDPEAAGAAIRAGAHFLVTPTLNVKTVEIANRYDRLIVPGALTPTEILTAFEAGAGAVKVFPAASFGPDYIRHVRGPLPHIPLMPTGGVRLDRVAEYVKAGAVALGLGGSLVGTASSSDQMAANAKKYVDAVKQARQQLSATSF